MDGVDRRKSGRNSKSLGKSVNDHKFDECLKVRYGSQQNMNKKTKKRCGVGCIDINEKNESTVSKAVVDNVFSWQTSE